MSLIKYCEGCKYNGRLVITEPCKSCCFGSKWDSALAPDKPEPKQNGKSEFMKTFTKDILNYCSADVIATQALYGHFKYQRPSLPKPKKVIFSDPCTIVIWPDNTKTIVRTQNGDVFDPEKGLAMAIAKKAYDNNSGYYDVFKKWLPKEKPPVIKEEPIIEKPSVPGKVRCSGNCDVCCPVTVNSKNKTGKGCKTCKAYISHFEKKADK